MLNLFSSETPAFAQFFGNGIQLEKNLVLSFHNSIQTVVLLKNFLTESRKDEKTKYLDRVLSAREATKRATMELMKQTDSYFPSSSDKHLFIAHLHDIVNSAANIATIMSMDGVLLSPPAKKVMEEIIAGITDMARDMNFKEPVDTADIMKQVMQFRQLVYSQQDRSSFLLMERIVADMQKIVYTLEKANEF